MTRYEDRLWELASQDERIVVLTAENRAAIRTLATRLPERFIDLGICEQTMLGAAAGLALRGRIVVVHALAAFLTMRAFEFTRTDVGIPRLPVKLVGYVPGVLSDANGPTHQAIEDVALMRGIPGMAVFAPCDELELVAAVDAMIAYDGPCYLRYFDGAPTFEHSTPYAPGRAEVLPVGGAAGRGEVVLATYGFLTREVVKAAEALAARGIAASVVNMRTVAPLDSATLLEHARAARLVVTVEDHFRNGGLYSAAAELFVANGVRTSLLPIGLADGWFRPGLLPDVLRAANLTASQIADRVVSELGQTR